LQSILVKVNRRTKTLEFFKDYFLVILIRGTVSWADFTVQQPFLISSGQERTKRYMPNQKELPRQNVVSKN
jgi:hypothetical protein